MDRFEQQYLFDDNPAYKDFTDKFKLKLTTDDCYTPPEVYDAVRDWACAEYGIDPASSIVQVFRERADFNAQLRFCTARSYETCEIYRAVMNAAWGEEWEEMQQCRCRTRK